MDAQTIIRATAIRACMLNGEVVDPNATEPDKYKQMERFIYSDILPGSFSEVIVPFRKATGADDVEAWFDLRWPELEAETRQREIDELQTLFDLAQIDYANSQLLKSVDSTAPFYREQSNNARIQADARVKKMLDYIGVLLSTNGQPGSVEQGAPGVVTTSSVPQVLVWG